MHGTGEIVFGVIFAFIGLVHSRMGYAGRWFGPSIFFLVMGACRIILGRWTLMSHTDIGNVSFLIGFTAGISFIVVRFIFVLKKHKGAA